MRFTNTNHSPVSTFEELSNGQSFIFKGGINVYIRVNDENAFSMHDMKVIPIQSEADVKRIEILEVIYKEI